jgi:sialic acid synthase SpsE
VAGEEITQDDLESKKPAGKVIPAEDFRSLLGKRLKKDLRAGYFITSNDLL